MRPPAARRILWDVLAPQLARYRRRGFARRIANFCYHAYLAYENHNYDPTGNGEIDVLRKLSRPAPIVIFDVGANVGQWALTAAAMIPNAHVHCFEVVKPVIGMLKANTAGTPRIVVNDFGLSEEEGEVEIKYYPEGNLFSSIFDYPHPERYVLQKGRVRAGDDYVNEKSIDRIDFLKIDVEGAEHLVLKGFSDSMRQGKIDIVQFEYGRVNILTRFLLRDFYALFSEYGYVVGKVYPNHVEFREYTLDHEDFLGPNFLAVRKELKSLIEILAA